MSTYRPWVVTFTKLVTQTVTVSAPSDDLDDIDRALRDEGHRPVAISKVRHLLAAEPSEGEDEE